MWNKIRPYVLFPLLSLAAGGLSALLTYQNMDLYRRIQVPPLSPPSILFPLVWSLLYVLLGVGSAMVYSHREAHPREARSALWSFGINLAINFVWSLIFFNLQAFLLSFLWLLLLWGSTLSVVIRFYRVHHPAGLLQIPYLLWVTFAGYLNLAIWLLNP